MNREIERKFLVDTRAWRPDPARGVAFRQGYLSVDPARVVRVRRAGDRAFLTIKGVTAGFARAEFEYPIPVADADAMLDQLCLRPIIEKTRYRESWAGFQWDVDVFGGENAGLVVAEVELSSPTEVVPLPPWVGDEISEDERYANARLVDHPYARWAHAG